MNYRLVITTDGRPDVLARTLESFDGRVRPRPTETLVLDDSGDEHYVRYLRDLLDARERDLGLPYRLHVHPRRLGFCRSVADAWSIAAEPGPPWIWWTEDDFSYDQHVELADLADVLNHEANVIQMALMRQPVNETEIAAGSLFALFRDRYELRGTGRRVWIESKTNFSTGCSLVRRRFMVERPWTYEENCEGLYSWDLLADGYRFGVWGGGEPWVTHFGARGGSGY